jgi:Rrf2 family protein
MVNQQFTFALHILSALAFAGEKMDSQELAGSVNTNPVVVRRLLRALARAGLVRTFAGKNGGAILRRSPDRISLCQIYDAVQVRPVIAVSQRKPDPHCAVSCQMKSIATCVADGAEAAVRRHLRQITLSQILRRIRRDCK